MFLSVLASQAELDKLYVVPTISSCHFCGAKRFPFEPSSLCCDSGKVRLAASAMPADLMNLFLDYVSPSAVAFRRNIRLHNNIFSLTSFVVRIDKDLVFS